MSLALYLSRVRSSEVLDSTDAMSSEFSLGRVGAVTYEYFDEIRHPLLNTYVNGTPIVRSDVLRVCAVG